MASICSEDKQFGIISWTHIAQETAADTALSRLFKIIEKGNTELDQTDPGLAAFWPICESIYVEHGVLMYQDRVVVPPSLRPQVMQHLHAAHQGISTMEQRARMIVYWPGKSKDILQPGNEALTVTGMRPHRHHHHHYHHHHYYHHHPPPHLKQYSPTSSTTAVITT